MHLLRRLQRPVRLLAVTLLATALAFTSGCVVVAAGAAGAGTVAYLRGELDATVTGPLDTVDAAANRAVQRLQFVKISEAKDALVAEIVARTAQDKKITITLNKVGDTLTRVRIRVGLFGDETISRALLDQINPAR